MTTNGGPARLLRVYGLWIVLVTAVVMGAAYAVSRTAPVEYKSSAIVVVEARVRENTTPVPPDMGTEKELAQSGLVVEPAARALAMDPGNLTHGLVISVAPDANVLTFAYTDGQPFTAQRRAEALAEAYVNYRNADKLSTQQATLVTPAFLPDRPVSRPIGIDLGIGLVIGLLLGIGTALLRDRMSDRIRGRGDFERVSGTTVLATVPRERRRRGADTRLPITLRAPETPGAESYRYLRSRLQPLLRDTGATILVTSASDGEGRTTTAANLAAALALAGRTVILADADLRRPRLHLMFDLDNDRGLTDLLSGDASTPNALRDGPVPRLRLLTAGPAAGGAADLLEGPRLARVLRALQRQCDFLVLDSAPLLGLSDGIALAALSDQVLLLGDYRRTTRGQVTRALTELGEVVDGNVSGVLLNAPRSAGGHTPYGRDQATLAPVAVENPPRVATVVGSATAVGSAVAPTSPVTGPAPSTVYSSTAAAPVIVPKQHVDNHKALEQSN